MSVAHAVVVLFAKELRLEWRGRARLGATAFFAVLTLLLFSFAAGPRPKLLAAGAAGYLWLALVFASTLALAESARIEEENRALEGLRLVPVPLGAVFLAKAGANTLFLALLTLIVVPLAVALYDVSVVEGFAELAVVMLLGCAAIAAPGTLYATIATQAAARDVLLPLLLFPIIVPGLIAAVRGTELVLEGDAMGALGSWTSLLVVFNVLYWIVCTLLFGRVVEA